MTTPRIPTPLLTSDEELACDRLLAELLGENDGVVRPLERTAPVAAAADAAQAARVA